MSSNISLWLKADVFNSLALTSSGVDSWIDRIGGLVFNDGAANKAQYVSNSNDFNFNPTIDFTSNTAQLTANSEDLI